MYIQDNYSITKETKKTERIHALMLLTLALGDNIWINNCSLTSIVLLGSKFATFYTCASITRCT